MPARTRPLLEREVLERLYFDQGLSLHKIAKAKAVPYSLVRDSFRAHGLKWRSRSEAMTGIVRSPETRAKVAAARRGTKDRPEVAAKKRKILRQVCDWNRGLTKHTDERVARAAEAFAAVTRTPEYREKMSRIATQRMRTTGGGFVRGYHDSPKAGRVYHMSSWELARFKELDADPSVLMYKAQPCAIPYPWDGVTKHYTPDILVIYEGRAPELEEVKPRRIIDNDKSGRVAAKLSIGRRFAHSRGWQFKVTDQEPVRC